MSKTEKNLTEAFAGESQANRKYLAYARRAADENLEGICKLFLAVAESEAIHARKHLSYLKGIKSTKENVLDALEGETHEFKNMYPQMIEDAKEEGERGAEISFRYANESEKAHAELFSQALTEMDTFPVQEYYICKACGYTAAKEPPDTCPVCGSKTKAFFRVE